MHRRGEGGAEGPEKTEKDKQRWWSQDVPRSVRASRLRDQHLTRSVTHRRWRIGDDRWWSDHRGEARSPDLRCNASSAASPQPATPRPERNASAGTSLSLCRQNKTTSWRRSADAGLEVRENRKETGKWRVG
ncbi:hypothetical protein E2562_033722 [Oryza meyeriana var. granulata]|uniref:Uncharacterized protein n=1 Tax=Oryza meyeriana var. granulata TaxID=110450 RepID=A0A6G1CAV6_9ORYZ|nr:hypothetical protein E2562_033722 [Oryza meyeriana var. granulata]